MGYNSYSTPYRPTGGVNGQFMWLESLHESLGSIGHLTEVIGDSPVHFLLYIHAFITGYVVLQLLGMNANALIYTFGAFINFCTNLGHSLGLWQPQLYIQGPEGTYGIILYTYYYM